MKMKIVSLLLVGVFLFATAVFAQECDEQGPRADHKGQFRKGNIMEDIMKELDLSEEQTQKLEELKKPSWEEMKTRRKAIHAKNREIKAELDKVETDKNRIKTLVDELVSLEREKIESRINHVLQVKEVLTPEQFQVLKQKREIKEEVRKEIAKVRRAHRDHKGYSPEEGAFRPRRRGFE
jgi:Spy/CpxP family protein refolding chaperone